MRDAKGRRFVAEILFACGELECSRAEVPMLQRAQLVESNHVKYLVEPDDGLDNVDISTSMPSNNVLCLFLNVPCEKSLLHLIEYRFSAGYSVSYVASTRVTEQRHQTCS